jgi:DNA-binding NarL/FixJ family response regulator
MLLESKPAITAVAVAASLRGLAERVDEFRPDVLLLDLYMEQPVIADIPALAARTNIIVVTAVEQSDQLLGAVRAGARGIVSKSAAVDTLMEALQAVANGHVWLSPALQSQLVGAIASPSADRLTTREREVVRLVALGLRNAEVAAQLFISAITVKTHLSRIFYKLGVRDRADLVLYAVRAGLIGVNEKPR